jgi:uncharacterized protein (UPF0332 family)
MTEGRERYATAARELLTKAQQALAQRDLHQASEKGWGAAAQIVKAVATRRGWQYQTHAALFEAVRLVMLETGDRRLQELFHAANSLHYNFYENWMPDEAVEVGLEQVKEFIQGMERFLTGHN